MFTKCSWFGKRFYLIYLSNWTYENGIHSPDYWDLTSYLEFTCVVCVSHSFIHLFRLWKWCILYFPVAVRSTFTERIVLETVAKVLQNPDNNRGTSATATFCRTKGVFCNIFFVSPLTYICKSALCFFSFIQIILDSNVLSLCWMVQHNTTQQTAV